MTNPERQPPRVGFVLHSMNVAGAEVLVDQIVRRLADAIVPTVFCLDGLGAIGERLQADGTPVVVLGRQPGLDWGLAGRFARALREHRIDVLHAHQYTPYFYAVLGALRARERPYVVLTEHGRHFPDVVSQKRRWANKLLLARFTDEVNAVCRFSADALQRLDGFDARPVEVIENGIEFSRYAPVGDKAALRQRLGFDPERRLVGCVARFHPVKDHAMLITAFAEVAARDATTDLVLAGDGPLRGRLEELARALGVERRVHFLGVRRDVPDLLAALDVFALTSISEAASLTLLEAMATALPVVVTRVGGNPEIVRDGDDGLLVPRGDHAACARAIGAVIADEHAAADMGASGRARVREVYTLERTVQRYHAVYERGAQVARARGRR